MSLIVLSGASGSGKTTIARAIAARRDRQVDVHFFDSIGVPPVEQMIAEQGSGEGWQRAKTVEWVHRLAPSVLSGRNVLLEGQTRIAFLNDAVVAAGLAQYRIIFVDCDDATRTHRLVAERGQPELANPTMLDWARFLRDEAERGGYEILDTSANSLDVCIERICRHF
jgi:shikimate kinase